MTGTTQSLSANCTDHSCLGDSHLYLEMPEIWHKSPTALSLGARRRGFVITALISPLPYCSKIGLMIFSWRHLPACLFPRVSTNSISREIFSSPSRLCEWFIHHVPYWWLLISEFVLDNCAYLAYFLRALLPFPYFIYYLIIITIYGGWLKIYCSSREKIYV